MRPEEPHPMNVQNLLFPCVSVLLLSFPMAGATEGKKVPPAGRPLKLLVQEYLAADQEGRIALRETADDTYMSLTPSASKRLRKELLKTAATTGPRLEGSGKNYFLEDRKGKYIVEGKPGKTLVIGLHGGGVGSGSAESMASGMGGGGYYWLFPEVLRKTERGWTDSGTEEFVLDLIEAAKRSGRVDPNRIYVTGHSMGGYGTWNFAAHHPDVFAGGAAYAGAPTMIYRSPDSRERYDEIFAVVEGVIPNLFNSRFLVFQSTDDTQVPPGPNQFATEALAQWKEDHPGGFDFRYMEVHDRKHRAPKDGYLPTLKWVTDHERVARPKKLLWQPVLTWKRHFHWVYWETPEIYSVMQFEAKEDNVIEVTTLQGDGLVSGMSLLLGDPLVDLKEEVVVRVDGEERFRGMVERTLSTLLLTIPRNDPELLFDARIDL